MTQSPLSVDRRFCQKALLQTALFAVTVLGMSGAATGEGVDFNRDIQPILSNYCLKCHGPDEETREADLRLDDATSAIPKAIEPGNPDASELMKRILSGDPDQVMPPPAANKQLTDRDKGLLREWIRSGATFSKHWAFVPPRPQVPPEAKVAWADSPIDRFIAHEAEKASLNLSPEAGSRALARRLSLDLIGLPPTPDDADRFATDPHADRHERYVDRLLASPAYGERWARRWLDLARYADTNGYEKDRVRSIWPYRDWVISALNADMPFDRFTILQLAGDMVPGASLEDRIATGFHRNTMINEEGGVDPNEFRFHAMVDRVSTTGTVWLGLTIGCAQCHTHKYDPITQRDYYQLMAFLNNCDEPEIPIPSAEIARRQEEVQAQIKRYLASTPEFSFDTSAVEWTSAYPHVVKTASGQSALKLFDTSIRVIGPSPERDTYTVEFDSDVEQVVALKLEVLNDPSLPKTGPGRAENGNLVLSEVSVSAGPADGSAPLVPVSVAFAESTARQPGFAAYQVLDGKSETGWAIGIPGQENQNQSIVLQLAQPVSHSTSTRWVVELAQNFGGKHTIGRFRLSVGRFADTSLPLAFLRRQQMQEAKRAWIEKESTFATRWQPLPPVEAKSNLPYLTILSDRSVLSSGDQTKSDTYQVRYQASARQITAIRLEAMTDERMPLMGPGRIFYEGPFGDFFLSEFRIFADGKPVTIRRAIADVANGANTPDRTLDGNPQTGWSIDGYQGKPHLAIFELDEPVDVEQALDLTMIFERYYSCGMGRFRLSYTTDPRDERQQVFPAVVEDALATPARERSPEMAALIDSAFLDAAEERTLLRAQIDQWRRQTPAFPTTLVMAERPPEFPRPTHVHKRGEFLQPTDVVKPDLPSLFGRLRKFDRRDRLQFARWLVDAEHPLTARVTVNRHWAALFGRGIVRTTEDFGYQGERPTHPELLDWLAVEWTRDGWSTKSLHRLMVTSRTYRQSSALSDEAQEKDPTNRWFARGPRLRLEAEQIRDSLLAASGLLSTAIGGPSVFPPQPKGVTSEGAYGPLEWKVSAGGDQYRRSLYTFAKRTAPYAMFTTFDAGSGEACLARREVSNTPLQSLTLLNDVLTMETARSLGIETAARPREPSEHVDELFKRCLSRPALAEEKAAITRFVDAQRLRLTTQPATAESIVGRKSPRVVDEALWTLAARTILNLDEAITKE